MPESPHYPTSFWAERSQLPVAQACISKQISPSMEDVIIRMIFLFSQVFAVSKKVHTTRTRALGVLTDDDTQIVSMHLFWCESILHLNSQRSQHWYFSRLFWILLDSPPYQKLEGVFFYCIFIDCLSSIICFTNFCVGSVSTDTNWKSPCLWTHGTQSKKLI